ncbi:MAG: hypothetical protein NZO16_00035 [Deltaproteobacteria bacterium]|nr:hypothetical protein [Deltaproteobacteria bacterium]
MAKKANAANDKQNGDLFESCLDELYLSADFKAERNLLAAVLARAICDAFGSADVEKHVRRTARQWIFGTKDSNNPFCFEWVCHSLEIDPQELRRMLRNYELNPEAFEDKFSMLK